MLATLLSDPLRSPDLDYAPPADEELLRCTNSYEQTTQGKRTRKTSPASAKRELDAKRAQRERRRQDRQQAKVHGRRQQWHEEFMQKVYAEVPNLGTAPNGVYCQERSRTRYLVGFRYLKSQKPT